MKSRPISLKKVENCFLLFKKFVVEYDTGDKDFKLWVTRLFYETICGFGKNNLDNIKTVNDVWKFSKNMWSQDPTWY